MADYIYAIASIPGGRFDAQSEVRLSGLMALNLPAATNPVFNTDPVNLVITVDNQLSQADKTTLDGLVARCNDYFIVTQDGGTTDIGQGGQVSTTAGQNSSLTITLQYIKGDGTKSNGYGETVVLTPTGFVPITPTPNDVPIDSLSWSASGQCAFVIGASLQRGVVNIQVTSDSLPARSFAARWN